MTNEELFTDLKQFIEATVSQQTAHLDSRADGLEQRIDHVEQNLGARIDTLDEKIDTIQDAIADTVQDHEQRLRRLETKTA
jgi:hypothetical protein